MGTMMLMFAEAALPSAPGIVDGAAAFQKMNERRTAYIAALKAADNDDISPLMEFIGPRDDLSS
jgi:hypothetical protein